MGNSINLWYEAHGYAFMVTLTPETIDMIRTRNLLGAYQWSTKGKVGVFLPKQLSLIQTNVYQLYLIPDTNIRIHLNVPIADQMDWNTPNMTELNYLIYMEG